MSQPSRFGRRCETIVTSVPDARSYSSTLKRACYRPNLAASGLVTGRSSLIGLVVPDLIHPFFAEVAKSLSFALRQHGCLLIIESSEEDPLLEIEEIERLLSHDLDALVVASAQRRSPG